MKRKLMLIALLLLPLAALAQTVALAPVPPDPASADERFLSISDASAVKFVIAGGTCIDWILQGAAPGGNSGTVVPTTPALGASNNDGVCASTVTVQGPVTGARIDFDGPAFSGATVSIGTATAAMTLANGIWSANFVSVPAPPGPPVVTGSSTLTWPPVTQQADGSPLTNLAGYIAYWGTSSGSYPNSANTGNVTTYVVGGLTPGTWFFTVTAVNTAGVESARSPEASKTVPGTAPPPPPPPPPPAPVDCVVSAWTLGMPQPAICPASGQQTHVDSRTVLVPAANGGAACPVLTQTVPLTCTPPPPADPCVASPLTFSVQTWPSADSGRRTLGYTTNHRARVTHDWNPQRAIAVDDRGCMVTIAR